MMGAAPTASIIDDLFSIHDIDSMHELVPPKVPSQSIHDVVRIDDIARSFFTGVISRLEVASAGCLAGVRNGSGVWAVTHR
jgi:hypothetical protein